MHKLITEVAICAALLSSLNGCSADVTDGAADLRASETRLDEATVALDSPSDRDPLITGHIVVEMFTDGVFLIDPSETPPPDVADIAGHFEVFLDSTDSAPRLVTEEDLVDVSVPYTTSPGTHKVIARLHNHDGSPTRVTAELDFKIKHSHDDVAF